MVEASIGPSSPSKRPRCPSNSPEPPSTPMHSIHTPLDVLSHQRNSPSLQSPLRCATSMARMNQPQMLLQTSSAQRGLLHGSTSSEPAAKSAMSRPQSISRLPPLAPKRSGCGGMGVNQVALPVSTGPTTADDVGDVGGTRPDAHTQRRFRTDPDAQAPIEPCIYGENERGQGVESGTVDGLQTTSADDVDDVSGRMQTSLTLNAGVVDKVWSTSWHIVWLLHIGGLCHSRDHEMCGH